MSAAGLTLELAGAAVAAIAGFLVGFPAWSAQRRGGGGGVAGSRAMGWMVPAAREGLVERVFETIHTNSLLLFGGMRVARTSVQQELRRRLRRVADPEYAFFPVYVDLRGTAEERFFAALAEGVFGELSGELRGLHPAKDVRGGEYGYRALVSDLKRVVQRLGESTDKRVKVVLLLDDVDELNGYDPRVNQKLRSLFMKSFAEQLVAVVSGVGIRKAWEREGSPWYNFFEEIEVELPGGSIGTPTAAERTGKPG